MIRFFPQGLSLKQALFIRVVFFFVLSCLFTLGAFLDRYGLWWDLMSHFRVHFCYVQFPCLFLFITLRKKAFICLAGFFLCINLFYIAPWNLYSQPKDLVGNPTPMRLKLLLVNVNTANRQFAKVEKYIQKMDPDILAILEISSRWLEELKPTLAQYPYFRVVPRDDNFGIGLFSKIPLKSSEIINFSDLPIPSITATLFMEGTHPERIFDVLVTHPLPPRSGQYYFYRNQQLENMIRRRKEMADRLIVLADMNATPWSHAFDNFKTNTNLRDSRLGFGNQSTWPAFLPKILLNSLGIPIDHCLLSKDFKVLARETGPRVGSDHLPLFILVGLQT
jgi:endonuclease/exonuclease/phosphatase (EEP) superfamily protein YafD